MQNLNVSAVTAAPECTMCLGPHDPDIHEATVSIHAWLREEILRRTGEENPAPESLAYHT